MFHQTNKYLLENLGKYVLLVLGEFVKPISTIVHIDNVRQEFVQITFNNGYQYWLDLKGVKLCRIDHLEYLYVPYPTNVKIGNIIHVVSSQKK